MPDEEKPKEKKQRGTFEVKPRTKPREKRGYRKRSVFWKTDGVDPKVIEEGKKAIRRQLVAGAKAKEKRDMAKKYLHECVICVHKDMDAIEADMAALVPTVEIKAKYGLKLSDINKHRAMVASLIEAQKTTQSIDKDRMLTTLGMAKDVVLDNVNKVQIMETQQKNLITQQDILVKLSNLIDLNQSILTRLSSEIADLPSLIGNEYALRSLNEGIDTMRKVLDSLMKAHKIFEFDPSQVKSGGNADVKMFKEAFIDVLFKEFKEDQLVFDSVVLIMSKIEANISERQDAIAKMLSTGDFR